MGYFGSFMIDPKGQQVDPKFLGGRNYYEQDKDKLIETLKIIIKHKLSLLPFETSASYEISEVQGDKSLLMVDTGMVTQND